MWPQPSDSHLNYPSHHLQYNLYSNVSNYRGAHFFWSRKFRIHYHDNLTKPVYIYKSYNEAHININKNIILGPKNHTNIW